MGLRFDILGDIAVISSASEKGEVADARNIIEINKRIKVVLSKASTILELVRVAILFVFCVSFPMGLYFEVDWVFTSRIQELKWSRLLPSETFAGSFQTAQAEYLYGTYHDQWLAICQGSVAEALPEESAAGRIAAIGLCQKPDAKKVLIIGSGLGLCRQLLRLPQIETVTWAHYDNEYVQKINSVLIKYLLLFNIRDIHTLY